jgi:hypothetical protein
MSDALLLNYTQRRRLSSQSVTGFPTNLSRGSWIFRLSSDARGLGVEFLFSDKG